MHEVKDGSRTLQFDGTLLGKSSSWRRSSPRWIEFELYRTENGSYILSRIGASLIYHVAACPLVKRYGLTEVQPNKLNQFSTPCYECNPSIEAPVVFPEKYRYWAQVSETPEAVLEALYKRDDSGARYLTYVAQRLLDEASDNDRGIDEVYRIERIP